MEPESSNARIGKRGRVRDRSTLTHPRSAFPGAIASFVFLVLYFRLLWDVTLQFGEVGNLFSFGTETRLVPTR